MKTAVLLSGGVDSSVALHLAKREGADLTAFYLKIWLEDELSFLGQCPWEEDLKHARSVCDQAGVPLHVLPLQEAYQDRIVGHVLSELKRGRTPSPDILCNQRIKFGLFIEKVGREFERIVTGHYAQVEQKSGLYWLKRCPDPVKDQTYFLSALNQEQLSKLWFPVGGCKKKEIRALAHELQLPNRNRRDSQGICFLGKIKYPEFVRYHLGEKEGDIIELETGRTLGIHSGVWFHTIGQRKGLGLGGGPWYVVRKDLARNTVYVTHADHFYTHAIRSYQVEGAHWISGEPSITQLETKVRHSPHLERCDLRPAESGRWQVELENPDHGIAPGQSSIFYHGEYCLGGGVICE